MQVRLHKNLTATPARQTQIQGSTQLMREIARELRISEDSVRRWCDRNRITDGSHIRPLLYNKFNQAQEVIAIKRRHTPDLLFEDLIIVTR